MIVIDASITASLVLVDEPDPPAAIQRRIYAGPLIAPAHWPAEIGNALLAAMRRGRLDWREREEAIGRVRSLEVAIVALHGDATWGEALPVADDHRLTLYDALYLHLALQRNAALASDDGDLVRAARARGVEVLTSLS